MSDSLWPHYCSPPGSSVHGLLHTTILESVAPLLQGIFLTRDQTHISCLASGFFTRVTWKRSPLPPPPPTLLHHSLLPSGYKSTLIKWALWPAHSLAQNDFSVSSPTSTYWSYTLATPNFCLPSKPTRPRQSFTHFSTAHSYSSSKTSQHFCEATRES